MNSKVFFAFVFLINFCSNAQYKYITNTAHHSLEKAIYINNEVIEGRTAFFEKQAEEKPLMFQKTKVRIGELNRLSNNVIKYIHEIQKEVNTERVLYNLLDDSFYKKLIFDSNGKLTKTSHKLKIKIDSLYNYSITINIHKLSQLEGFSKDHFKTNNDYYDYKERKLTYFENLFYDTSNYGIMMTMYCLVLDVQIFQLLYYGTVMRY